MRFRALERQKCKRPCENPETISSLVGELEKPYPTAPYYGPQHGFTPNCATWAHKARIFASASSPGGGGGGGEASGFIAGKRRTSLIEFLFVRNIVNLSIPVWKSTSASGAPDYSSLSHFSAMTRPSWLGRAARSRHSHAIEQASRRWRGGRCDDSERAVKV